VAGVLASLTGALRCVLATPEEFKTTLLTAGAGGHPADTVAPIPCSVSGAYHGLSRLPTHLLDGLEFRDQLIALADGLHDLALRLRGPD
jgi:ADP-ribosylglycohydrolase